MTESWLPTIAQCPTATFLLNQTQLSSPRLSEQIAMLDHGNRAIVLDRYKERVTVIGRDGQQITEILAHTDRWGWIRGEETAE